jgi:hypothetical protein
MGMDAHFPAWLHTLAIASVGLGLLCSAVIIIDELSHPQRMWIMNLVWPLTALFGTLLWLFAYFRWGRADPGERTGASRLLS